MRILIVEDEKRIAASLKKGFEQERFTVDLAYSGDKGYDLAISENYDLLILDLLLPELDGLSILKSLRKNNISVPILLLTAKSQLQDKVTGLNLGADDYLTKPFSFAELLARVNALVRRPKNLLPDILEIGGLQLNKETFEVKRNSQKINLTKKEFCLLEFLLRHPRRILTKEQIIENVWDYDADILPNTLEVFIKNLRRKIDLPFSGNPQLIHTVRGFGYKISD